MDGTLRVLTAVALLAPFAAAAQLSITAPNVPVVQDFNVAGTSHCTTSSPWQDDVTIPFCYSDRPSYNYSNGCANTGGLHIAGVGGETALGGRGSTATNMVRWGVRFKNNTGVTLGALRISMRCEQWSYAGSNLANNVVPFSYRASATPITDVTSGTYTNDPTWNLVSLTPPTGCSGTTTATDGNSPAYSFAKEGCITVTLAPGDEIMLRWWDTNDPCNDHMLCVDDLSVTGYPVPVIVADGPTTFCDGDSVTLSVAGFTGILWSTGVTADSITVYDAGTYTAQCTTDCGVIPVAITVTVNDGPSISVQPSGPLDLCPGQHVTLTASGGDTYTWSTGSTDPAIVADGPGTYTVEAENGCGTDATSIVIGAAGTPSAAIDPPGPIEICANGEVHLHAVGQGDPQWSTGATTSSITVMGAGTWTLEMSTGCGSATASVVTSIIPLPTAAILANDLTLCAGEHVTLTAEGDGDILWSTGAVTASIEADEADLYTVTISNECGSDEAAVTVVSHIVEAAFSPSTTGGPADLTVDFTNESDPPGPAEWDLGIGTSMEISPSATYTEPGEYEVMLIAHDPSGTCADTVHVLIIVAPGDSWITVPNVFTPNGDGKNDAFRVQYAALADFSCSLIDRWGIEVAHFADPDQGWNGKSGSDTVPDGVYYYVIRAQGIDGRSYELNGHVTLLR